MMPKKAGRSTTKNSGTNTNPYSSKRRGTKASSVKKSASSASSASRGLHGGRRKSN